jgi:ribosomal protein S12 methylthiotransferase
VHYLYPESLTDELVELIALAPQDRALRRHAAAARQRRHARSMKRGHGGDRLRRVVETVRSKVPGVTFRTAFIVGHPGETDEDFTSSSSSCRGRSSTASASFATPTRRAPRARRMDEKVAAKASYARHRKLMAVQRPISRKKNKARIGQTLDVLVEGPSTEHEFVMQGRHAGQAPEVDGAVFLSGAEVSPGTIVQATITQSAEFDLVGEVEGGDGWLEAEEAKKRAEASREAAKKAVKRKVSLRIAQ